MPTPVPTATATNTPTNTPTVTPVPEPVVRLALDVETEVEGYWTDGTANVRLTMALHNQGSLSLGDSQAVKVYCVHLSNISCGYEEAAFTLTNGFGPESEHVTMRLPPGTASLLFDYGGETTLTLHVEVPDRIVGVERAVWECYRDRSLNDEGRSCSGWGAHANVVKWLNDVPVKMWAVGDDRYLEILKESIAYLSPILDLDFESVPTKEEADFKAYMGIPRSEAEDYGLEEEYYVDYAGFASWGNRKGESISGYAVVWLVEDRDWNAHTRRIVESITLHEVLHAMAPVGHTNRPTSIEGGSGLRWLSPMDEALLRLNAHHLVEPGMTMDEVRSLIVFSDELLDAPRFSEPSTIEMVWRASVGLLNAGSVRFKIRGGWTDTNCNLLFGVRRGLATYEVIYSEFDDRAPVAHFQDGTTNIYIVWSESAREWQDWLEDKDTWRMAAEGELHEASYWWPTNTRLHLTLRSLLNDATPEDIAIADRSNGTIALEVTLDESYVTFWAREKFEDEAVEFQLVLDDQTYALEGYTWRRIRSQPSEHCDTYEEEAQHVELGVQVEIPEVIRRAIESP